MKLNLHRAPENLVQQQYPDLLYKLADDTDGLQAIARHKMYLEKPLLGSHFKQADHIENIAAEMATACAGAELVGHVLTSERTRGHQRYSKDLTDALAHAWTSVQSLLDMDEMRKIMHHHGHDLKYDIRVHTNNERLHQNYHSLTELCEKPIKMRLRVKQGNDAVTNCIKLLNEELRAEPAAISAEAQYCASELGPELMRRLDTVRSNLFMLDQELRSKKQPAQLHPSKEIPEPVIDVSARDREISAGRVADIAAFRNRLNN